MPNVAPGNLNQAPGQVVSGALPASLSGVVAPQAPDLRYQQWLQMQMQNYVRQQMAQSQPGMAQGQPQQ